MKTIILLALVSQFPSQPDKQTPQAAAPVAPSKAPQAAFASPQGQAAPFASPQQSFAPVQQYEPQAVVLRTVPQVYAVQRQVVVAAAPVAYAAVAYDPGDSCVVQQQVVRQAIVRQHVAHNVVVNRAFGPQISHNVIVGADVGVGRAPRKVVTKTVTKVRRGLFGR